LAENLVRYSVFSQAAGAIGNIILNLILIPKFGVTGAAVSTVVSYSIAGYFSLMAFSQTRPICLIIARSLLAPLNLGARGGRL
ncbi:flippase, partial [candidate division KSB1 bacterium]|nr:flippase [Phycisphaerae bacterium]NIV95852.1 flippase [candidate division KSB1 bacterium]NIX27639.1 flippase [Phycisphaerae bacterium]